MKLRASLLASALIFIPILNSPVAQAHAALVSTIPAQGAIVAKTTNKVTMHFGEDILVIAGKNPNSIVVSDSRGKKVSFGTTTISGAKITTALKAPLSPGKYTVAYRVVSADAHVVAGSYSFTVK
jgi:methionine-rich copper-binding protein CopC